MRRAWIASGVLLVLVAAAGSAFVAKVTFLFLACGTFDDTGGPHPARDSAQGRLCVPAQDDIFTPQALADWVLVGAALLAVALTLAFWRRGWRARVLGAAGILALPIVAVAVLAVPSDTCSDAVRRSPGSDCATGG